MDSGHKMKSWFKNSRYLFDRLSIEEHSVTCTDVQWLPCYDERSDSGFEKNVLRLMVGTVADDFGRGNVVDYELVIPKIQLRTRSDKIREYSSRDNMITSASRFTIAHEGRVNRCRYMPQRPDVIATQVGTSEVHLFVKDWLPSILTVFDMATPALRLKGQEKPGIGLCWSPHRAGHLLSSCRNGCVYHWNITDLNRTKKGALVSQWRFACHRGPANDVAWSNHLPHVFATVGSDCRLCIWDDQSGDRTEPAVALVSHEKAINCVAFNKLNPVLLATGSSDKSFAVWDLRKMKEKLSSVPTPDGPVTQMEWCPHNESVLLTGHSDGHVNIWNTGKPFGTEAAAKARFPTPLMFSYDGHQGEVNGISWHNELPFLIASTSNDNYIHVWQMGISAYKDALPCAGMLSKVKGCENKMLP